MADSITSSPTRKKVVEPVDNSVHGRLYRTPRMSIEENMEKDVLIAALLSDTIRWIKRRRTFEAKHRVAITHFRESQLREIFVGLDFEDENVIDLDELKTRLITPRSSSMASVDRPSTA